MATRYPEGAANDASRRRCVREGGFAPPLPVRRLELARSLQVTL